MSVTKTIEIEARVDKAEKDLEGVAEGVQSIDKNLKDVKKSSNVAAKGIKGIGTALKAAGIGLMISLLGQLKEVFSSNQRVADGFSTVLETVSVVFNQVATAAFSVYDQITDTTGSFDAMGKVIKGLITLAFTPLKLAFYGISLGVKEAQLIWEQSFFGDDDPATIRRLKKEILETKENIAEVAKASVEASKSIYNNFSEAVTEVSEIGTTIVKEIKKIDLADARATAEANVRAEKASKLATARNRIILEQKDREAEKLRQVRDDESATIEDRIKANNDLALVLKEQERLMLKNADAILNAAQAQFDKNGNDENALALLEAKAEKEGILAQITGFQSEQMTNVNSLERERIDIEKQKREDDLEYYAQEADRKAKEDEDKKKAHEEELKQKEEIRQATLDNLDTIISAAGSETKIGKALFIAKQAMLVKEQIVKAKATLTELGMIAAKSGADIASGAGATAKVGFPQNVPLLIAFAAQAAGIFSSIKSAVSAAKGSASKMGGSGGGGSVSMPRMSAAASAPPAFNVVGASETNQLAQSIGQDEKQPVKAYVVSNEVSDAQALDRNIVESASIG